MHRLLSDQAEKRHDIMYPIRIEYEMKKKPAALEEAPAEKNEGDEPADARAEYLSRSAKMLTSLALGRQVTLFDHLL